MTKFQKVFLRVTTTIGDTDQDLDKYPDRIMTSGTVFLKANAKEGTADNAIGPDGVAELNIPSNIECEIVDGWLTYHGDPYVWLMVSDEGWNWNISFTALRGADNVLRKLDSFNFTLQPATEAQKNDPNYPGVNLAPLVEFTNPSTGQKSVKGDTGWSLTEVNLIGDSTLQFITNNPVQPILGTIEIPQITDSLETVIAATTLTVAAAEAANVSKLAAAQSQADTLAIKNSVDGAVATATTKAQEATTAAGTATTAAGTATTKAGEATGAASTATTAAGTATTKAGEATTAAGTATTKAGEAIAAAGTATTKAGEAVTSAADANAAKLAAQQAVADANAMIIPNLAVTAAKIADKTIVAGKVADGTLTGTQIALGSIQTTKLELTARENLVLAANSVQKSFGTSIGGAPLYMSPESSSAVAIPYYMNDIAFNDLRGGATRIYKNGVLENGLNTGTLYDPTSSAVTISSVGLTELVVEVDMCKSFSYSTIFGYAVNEAWRAKNVKIEHFTTLDGWVVDLNLTNVTGGEIMTGRVGGANPMTKLRFTFSNFNSTQSFRMGQIFAINFSSDMGAGPFVDRGGGSIYGNLRLQCDSTTMSSKLRVGNNGTTGVEGMQFGTDTYLYRNGPSILRTDGIMLATQFRSMQTAPVSAADVTRKDWVEALVGAKADKASPAFTGAVTIDGKAPVVVGTVPYDTELPGAGEATTRAVGYNDCSMGISLRRAVTIKSVKFRCTTADVSGNLVVELRKNGTTVAGSSTTIAAASQVAGATTVIAASGTASFAKDDILTVYVTAIGATPGKGLTASVEMTAD